MAPPNDMAGSVTDPIIAAPRATLVREPGLLPYRPGHERYRAKGGGAVVVWLQAGDKLSVTDPEGR